MHITINPGWWLLPTAITLVAFGWAAITCRPSSNPGYGEGIVGMLVYGAALIVSLTAWLAWAVLS